MPEKILIVDDLRANRQVLRGILQQTFDVAEAENGREALNMLAQPGADYSAVLMDLIMPVMDGFDALAQIRSSDAYAHLPVIITNSADDSEAEMKALTLGASDFIHQPYQAELVRRRVSNLVRLSDAMRAMDKLRAEKAALRISEEQYRVAASSGGRVTARYDIQTDTYYRGDVPLTSMPFGSEITHAARAFIDQGVVAQECASEYLALCAGVRSGVRESYADLALNVRPNATRWFRCNATVIYDDAGTPAQAIIVYSDITEQREKETVYRKWQQALQQKMPDSYTLFRCNLSHNECYETMEGMLLKHFTLDRALSFNTQTREYALHCVHPDDREQYLLTVNSDTLLANYHRNRRMEVLEFREMTGSGDARWLRLTIELVEYPNSTEIEAYMMYEDIHESKIAELNAREMAEKDHLTGVLNRLSFAQRVERIIRSDPNTEHALLMLDVDGFKQLNDKYGHAAGDRELVDIANALRSVLRQGDLVGRLGGDEFVVFLKGVSYDAVIEKNARQICALTRKAFSADMRISASVGVAVYPRDGSDFDALYHGADAALYSVKNTGKDNFAFYNQAVHSLPGADAMDEDARSGARVKRRMLIVDDNAINRAMLVNLFSDDYLIETANDGHAAMVRLRHFGTSLSVVLLDLVMPGMDGFQVLERMRASLETRSIPVIVVSGEDERSAGLRAIKAGAADYVAKPIDPDLIRLRVESAVSKAESERLRAQNSYLLLQSGEEAKYRTVLDSTGTVVIEFDWMGGVFTYDNSISDHIAGTYDDRRLWQILLSDMVAETMDVQAMQEMVRAIADDRGRDSGSQTVRLKTPNGSRQWFCMRVFKRKDDFQLTNKLIITFVNINEEVLAEKRLRYQAERDELTGLLNRKAFYQKAAELAAQRQPGYYVMASFDIDNFKVINDQYGSAKGDEVLRYVAQTFTDGFDAAGGLVCRITADNFAVLYPLSFIQSGKLEGIHAAVRRMDGSIPPISFSIGRYVVDDLSLPVGGMYDRATLAKASIKGRFDVFIAQYDETMRDQLLRQQEIVNEMNGALRAGQFEVWFQPQMNYATSARVGAEALVRWRHPQRGLVPPGEFIPVFEQNGFIFELDQFVWEKTCAYLRQWTDEGRSPLPISVNVSRYDLLREGLCDVLTGLVQKYSLPPDLLRLEITESAFAKNTAQIIAVVKKLILQGFTIEIDDFGSAYSSLNTLKDVPAQVLKMDMRFLESSENSDRGGNILESVVRMAKWLGMSVIAEGVETRDQAEYLKSIGCAYIQGFLYAKPMPASEYLSMAQTGGREEKLLALETVQNYDNNTFWNPGSMDSMIFNTYVGGACIFEWSNGHIEVLRANDKYARNIGGDAFNAQDALHISWEEHMDEEAARATRDAIERTIQTGDDATYEAVYHNLFGMGRDTWLRTTFRVIASTTGRYLLYATNVNLTRQREAEAQTHAVLERLQAIMDSVNCGVTAAIVRGSDVEFLFANRRYAEIIGDDLGATTGTVNHVFDRIHPEDRPRVLLNIAELNTAGGTSILEYRVMRADGETVWVRCTLSVTHLSGIEEPVQLAITSDITREKESAQRIEALNQNLETMMNDMPGGFVRLRVQPDGRLDTEYVNDKFCAIRGMTREEVLATSHDDAMNTVHPDDVALVRDSVLDMIATGETRRIQYRLLHADGHYVPLTVFGRMTRSDDGGMAVNVYYVDMSENEKRELSVRETIPFVLSAIMKSSADLSFAKDRSLKYLCCSRGFAKMVGLDNEADIAGKTDYDLFADREMAERYRADDQRLLESGESLIEYLEPIPSADGMQRFSSTSKYVLRDTAGAVIGLYGTGRDVTEYRTAFERLKLLTDSMPGGLATYVMTSEGLRITYFNDGLCKLFGCTREEYAEATRGSVITTVFEEDVPRLQQQIERMIKDGTPVDCTYRVHVKKDGGFKWVNLRATPAQVCGGLLQAHAVLYDVTEQKMAEDAARVHEAEMRLVMTRFGKMLCEYDPARHVLTVPEAYAAQYGLPPVVEDVPNSLIAMNVIDPCSLNAYRALYSAIQNGEAGGCEEYRVRFADGTSRWERAEFIAVKDSEGRAVKVMIVVEDTTQQHVQYELEQARPTLSEDNLLVHALFNLNTGETLDYAYQSGGEVPRAERTAFLFGGDHLDTIIPDETERVRYRELNDPARLLALYESGETELSIDYRRRMRDGDVIWVRNLLRMVREPSGNSMLLFEYCYNIETEKFRDLMYHALVHDNYDYVARVYLKTGHYTVIANTDVDYGMPEPDGDDFDEVVHETARRYVYEDDREKLLQNLTRAQMRRNLSQTDRFQHIFRLARPDGELLYKKMTAYYLDREREILIVVREDVSAPVRDEMRKNEQLSDALNAANQASRAKSQFLSRMSHELRTPMNAIIGLAALSASEVENPKSMEDSLGKIGMSARYLLSLINDILEMSRIESGKIALNEAPFDFERMISEVNNVIFTQAEEKGLDYDAAVTGYTEPSYVGDQTKLQQILINILGNAVKFTPTGGRVTLTIEQLRRTKKGATMRFTITDTGVGIDEAFIPSLFEPFSQEMSEASAGGGTGLGLAITKSFVELMNGKISVNSIKGVGSVFTVVVHLGITRESERYLDMAASMRLDRMRALVVDDDVLVCKSTQGILKTLGMQAEWAESGYQAVECVRAARNEKRDFDIVIIDWKMPDMDGIETTRRVRTLVGPDVTIIIMTAYDWRAIEREAREAGVDLFMEKPLFQSSVMKAFEQVFMAQKANASLPPPARPDLSGKRILAVEDNPLNIEVVRRLLERVGAEVVTAVNGLEALEMFTTQPDGYFDAILMDIRMPVMDGLTATKSIRKLKKASGKTVPIIAMTANAFDEDMELSLSSGMNAHLIKPVDPQRMYATIKRLTTKA